MSKRRSYTDAERMAALALAARIGPSRAARSLGIPHDTLVDWRAQGSRGVLVQAKRESAGPLICDECLTGLLEPSVSGLCGFCEVELAA